MERYNCWKKKKLTSFAEPYWSLPHRHRQTHRQTGSQTYRHTHTQQALVAKVQRTHEQNRQSRPENAVCLCVVMTHVSAACQGAGDTPSPSPVVAACSQPQWLCSYLPPALPSVNSTPIRYAWDFISRFYAGVCYQNLSSNSISISAAIHHDCIAVCCCLRAAAMQKCCCSSSMCATAASSTWCARTKA